MTEALLPPTDTSRYLADLVTCNKCLGVMEDPVTTPCSHSYCRGCAEGMIHDASDSIGEQKKFSCFMCDYTIRMDSVQSLKDSVPISGTLLSNEKVNNVIGILKGEIKQPVEHCERCRKNEAVIVCLECDTKCNRFCDQCNIRTHRGKTKDHVAASFLKSAAEELGKWKEGSKAPREMIKASIKNIDNSIEASLDKVKTQREAIVTGASELHAAVNKQSKELREQCQQHRDQQMKTLRDARRELVSGVALINKLELDIKRATSEDSKGKATTAELPALKQQFEQRFKRLESATGTWKDIPCFQTGEKSGFGHSLVESMKAAEGFPNIFNFIATPTKWAQQKEIDKELAELVAQEANGKEDPIAPEEVDKIQSLPAAKGNQTEWRVNDEAKEVSYMDDTARVIPREWNQEASEDTAVLRLVDETSYSGFSYTTTAMGWTIKEEEVFVTERIDETTVAVVEDAEIEGDDKRKKQTVEIVTWDDVTAEVTLCPSRKRVEEQQQEEFNFFAAWRDMAVSCVERPAFKKEENNAFSALEAARDSSIKNIRKEQQALWNMVTTLNAGDYKLVVAEKRKLNDEVVTKEKWLEAEGNDEAGWEAAEVIVSESLIGNSEHMTAINSQAEEGKEVYAVCHAGNAIRQLVIKVDSGATVADVRAAIVEASPEAPECHKDENPEVKLPEKWGILTSEFRAIPEDDEGAKPAAEVQGSCSVIWIQCCTAAEAVGSTPPADKPSDEPAEEVANEAAPDDAQVEDEGAPADAPAEEAEAEKPAEEAEAEAPEPAAEEPAEE